MPEAGDVVWLDFSPQSGHEQAGHRPALVLSPSNYNRLTGLMICCPMTTQIKGYAFEVIADGSQPGAILSEQVKSVDWRSRKAVRKSGVTKDVLADVRAKLRALMGC